MKILVLNGPNLNMLGIREPSIYGSSTYDDLVDMIQQAYFDKVDGIVINPGAYTHTSVALLDALKAVSIPAVEVHISQVSEREPFRQNSYVSYYCFKTIMGEGFDGYIEAIDLLAENYKASSKS